jgi:hypothetical protein
MLLVTALNEQMAGLVRARDRLPFDACTDRAIGQLLGMLAARRLEVRRVEHQFLPARALLVRSGRGGALVGGVNVSRAGLRGEPAVTLGHHGTPAEDRLGKWFDELWAVAAPFDLAGLYQRLTANFPPYLIYLRVLLALYGAELEEEAGGLGEIPITGFQQHGVWRAMGIMRRYGGVLIADGVGLGKTFTAGEIVRQYRERRQRVLLVCPATLRDSTWAQFLNKYQLFVECVSYEQLAADAQLGGDRENLKSPVEEYALVVIDEAQNYRNPSTPARAKVLRRLLAGPRRDLVLLSATPVNNSLWDLYHLLWYFLKRDAALADRGVLSIREQFLEAMQQDPFDLNPDLLYPILDATTVKRTRHFVKKHYADNQIKLPDGTITVIQFPKPIPSTINYSLDQTLPGFLNRLEAALMPVHGRPQLTMARYQVENYIGGVRNAQDHAVVGLLRSALFKRFESSVRAFAKTTEKMVREHELFLAGLDRGVVLRKEVMRELSAADQDEDSLDDLLDDGEVGDRADQYDLRRLRRDVESDLDLLREFHRATAAVQPDHDPKLEALSLELSAIVAQADKDGIDEQERRRDRKVLVFSYYSDTIDWIEGYLQDRLAGHPRLRVYQGRLASVAGTESRGGVSREHAVIGFAPETSGRVQQPEDRFDILLSTDVLAEGLNLQQCRNIINYDLPWNPMRLVQRHGRVDRIGSKHPRVFLRTFFPDTELNRLLDLEQRVRRKLAQAAASVGVEAAPIENAAETDVSFAETRGEIERLREADATIYEAGGTPGAAQTGEEYRQELRKALRRLGDRIRTMPWRAGSGLRKGEHPGYVFCAAVGDRIFVRFAPAADEPVVRELGMCLRLVECQETTERVVTDAMLAGVYGAWQRARQDIYNDWTTQTDPANLQPRVGPFSRQLAEFLRANPPSGVTQDRLTRCLEAIEAPIPRREESELRRVFDQEYPGNRAKAEAVVRTAEALGLEPFQPPDPLPPISPDEIHLICWMGIEAEK